MRWTFSASLKRNFKFIIYVFKSFNFKKFSDSSHGYENKIGCEVQSYTLSSSKYREITSVNGDNGNTYNDQDM